MARGPRLEDQEDLVVTDQDILNKAKDACSPYEASIFASPWGETWVKRFGRIIETQVREECARTCEALQDWPVDATPYDCAQAIRSDRNV
jgi:hypothetical protein